MNRRSFLFHVVSGILATVARAFGRDGALENRDSCRPSAETVLPSEPWRSEAGALPRWRAAARHPIVESSVSELRPLLSAVRLNQPVRFRYFGGSRCGAEREVSPGLLFTVDGFPGAYLSGYCHVRCAERTFLVGRMESVALGAG